MLTGDLLLTTAALPNQATPITGCTDISYVNRVYFELNQDYLGSMGRFKATCSFAYGPSFQNANGTAEMVLLYDKSEMSPELSRQVFEVPERLSTQQFVIWDINIVVTDMASGQVIQPGQGYENVLLLYTELARQKKCSFDCNACISGFEINKPTDSKVEGDVLHLSWQPMPGAIEYDLEWIFVENYDDAMFGYNGLSIGDIAPDFNKNAGRVTLRNETYTLPNIFEQGYVAFRVRAKGLDQYSIANNDSYTISTGVWNTKCDKPSTLEDYFSLGLAKAVSPHEQDMLNWQSVSTFAEGGKRKDVVTYFDGAMYNRQTVSLNNTDNKAVVLEQYYDHIGRAAVTSLPGPVNDARIRFYSSFNQNLAGQPFGKTDFDLDGTAASNCYSVQPEMSPASGVSKYYSGNNDFYDFSHRDFIPDAGNMPYVRTHFTPDATGRISMTGNLGPEFQIGQGHETKYEYGTPSQEELDVLFGNNVGFAAHYKREAVRDPNGQISLTYKSPGGKTIASCLAGEGPANLDKLDSWAAGQQQTSENLLTDNNPNLQDYCINVSKVFSVLKDGTNTFSYHLDMPANPESCFANALCYNCAYDFQLQIFRNDACQQLIYDSGPRLVGKPRTLSTDPCLPASNNTQTGEVVNTCCSSDPNSLTFELTPPSVSQFLTTGSYTIVKKLCVNQRAADEYVEFHLNAPNNTCIRDLQSFIDESIAAVDVNQCDNFNCEANPAIEGADLFCDPNPNYCETIKRHLIADFTPPYGQYALLSKDLSVPYASYTAVDPLSFFSSPNALPLRPEFRFISNNSISFLGQGGTPYMVTNPQGVSVRVNDPSVPLSTVVEHWKQEWSEQLIQYHPEYCMYEFCIEAEKSFEFDTELSTTSFADAVSKNYLTSSLKPNIGYIDPLLKDAFATPSSSPLINALRIEPSSNITDVNWLSQNVAYHFANIDDDQNTGPDVLLGSLIMAHCMPDPSNQANLGNLVNASNNTNPTPNNLPAAQCTPPTTLAGFSSIGTTDIDNEKRWIAYRGIYLAQKTKIVEHLMNRWRINRNCDNNCLGASNNALGNNSPGVPSTPSNPQGPSIPLPLPNAYTPPCDPSVSALYTTKIKRYVSSTDAQNSVSPRMNPQMGAYGDPTDQQNYPTGRGITLGSALALGSAVAGNPTPWCNQSVPCAPREIPAGCTPAGTVIQLAQAILAGNSSGVLPVSAALTNNGLLQELWQATTLPTEFNIVNLFGNSSNNRMGLMLEGKGRILNITFVGINTLPAPSVWQIARCDVNFTAGNFQASIVLTDNNGNTASMIMEANTALNNWCVPPCPNGPVVTVTRFPGEVEPLPTPSNPTGPVSSPSVSTSSPCNNCGDLEPIDLILEEEPCSLRLVRIAEAQAYYAYQRYREDLRRSVRQKYLDKCILVNESMTRNYQDSRFHFTLYYYDQSGQLIATVPPEGVKPLLPTQAASVSAYRAASNGTGSTNLNPVYPAHTKVTQYWFNTMNLAYKQLTPDGGTSTFYYDYLGRMLVSQDADQADVNSANASIYGASGKQRFSYTLYDALGRINESGQAYLPLNNISAVAGNNGAFAAYDAYSNRIASITHTRKLEKTTTKYDSPDVQYGAGFAQNNLRGRVSSSFYFEREQSTPGNYVLYSYDVHGNVDRVRNVVIEPLKFVSEVHYDYDLLSGKVNEVTYNPGQSDRLTHRYEYDADNRLTYAKTTRDGVLWDIDAHYIYYPHGPLARTVLGQHKVQGTDHTYTLQGWLKSVNSEGLQPAFDPAMDAYGSNDNPNQLVGRDATGYALHYRSKDYTAIGLSMAQAQNHFTQYAFPSNQNGGDLWNGNIRAMTTSIRPFMNYEWSGKQPGLEHVGPAGTYYGYDHLNRLAVTRFWQGFYPKYGSWKASPKEDYWNAYTYDGDGNIKTLRRHGALNTFINGTQVQVSGQIQMDDLAYDYPLGSNRLTSVNDLQTNSAAYTDVPALTHDVADFDGKSEYLYHANGALFADVNSGLYSAWNMLHKPKFTISFATGNITRYYYSPSGQRLAKLSNVSFAEIGNGATPNAKLTLYQRDASGNVMATYEADALGIEQQQAKLESHTIYGASRLAEWLPEKAPSLKVKDELSGEGEHQKEAEKGKPSPAKAIDKPGTAPTSLEESYKQIAKLEDWAKRTTFKPDFLTKATLKTTDEPKIYQRVIVWKRYELSNHLGNVLATVSDRKIPVEYDDAGKIIFGGTKTLLTEATYLLGESGTFFEPDIATANDYYPFGMAMPGRMFKAEGAAYRYGFNGKENDNEYYSDGGFIDFGDRGYDCRIGRFTSLDPHGFKMPDQSPYAYAGNSPVTHIDQDGQFPCWVLQYGINVGINMLTQMVTAYMFDDKVKNWGDAWDQTSFWTAAGEGIVDMAGSKKFQMAANATMGIISYGNQVGMENMTWEGMMKSGAIGLLEPIIGDAVKKYGVEVAKKGLQKMGMTDEMIAKVMPKCFIAGTKILTNNGLVNIEQIAVGDTVWAFSETELIVGKKVVTNTFVRKTHKLITVHVEAHQIVTTPEHPFYVQGIWKTADELLVGDSVLLFNGRKSVVGRLTVKDTSSVVYNFTVADFHTYFVSEAGVLVHNNNCGGEPKNKNSNEYTGPQAVYQITQDADLNKFGKADMTKISKKTGNPKRLQSQLDRLARKNPNSVFEGEVIYQHPNISTKDIKKVETSKVQEYVDTHGTYPPGNQNHPGVTLPKKP